MYQTSFEALRIHRNKENIKQCPHGAYIEVGETNRKQDLKKNKVYYA